MYCLSSEEEKSGKLVLMKKDRPPTEHSTSTKQSLTLLRRAPTTEEQPPSPNEAVKEKINYLNDNSAVEMLEKYVETREQACFEQALRRWQVACC